MKDDSSETIVQWCNLYSAENTTDNVKNKLDDEVKRSFVGVPCATEIYRVSVCNSLVAIELVFVVTIDLMLFLVSVRVLA
jgi:hypothetical protein